MSMTLTINTTSTTRSKSWWSSLMSYLHHQWENNWLEMQETQNWRSPNKTLKLIPLPLFKTLYRNTQSTQRTLWLMILFFFSTRVWYLLRIASQFSSLVWSVERSLRYLSLISKKRLWASNQLEWIIIWSLERRISLFTMPFRIKSSKQLATHSRNRSFTIRLTWSWVAKY